MRALKTVAGAALLALMLTAPAGAVEEGIVPPDNSAIHQYRETLPAPGGGKTTGGPDRSPSKVLGKKRTEQLERYGADGEAAAELAASAAPAGGQGRGAGKGSGGQGADGSGSSSPLAEVAGQATGVEASEGVGWLLPLIVALAAIGGIIFAVARRRRAEN